MLSCVPETPEPTRRDSEPAPVADVCAVSPVPFRPRPEAAESTCNLISSHQTRQASHAAPRQSAPQAAECTLVKLAGAAFVDAQCRADFAKAEITRIPQTDYRPIAGGQPVDLLPEDHRSLTLGNQRLRRLFGRRGDPALDVRSFLACIVLPCEVHKQRPAIAPNGVQHLTTDAKFRITGERRTGLRAERPFRLQKTDVSRLNEIRHLNAAASGQPRVNSAGKRANEAAHVFGGSRRIRICGWWRNPQRRFRYLRYLCHFLKKISGIRPEISHRRLFREREDEPGQAPASASGLPAVPLPAPEKCRPRTLRLQP